MEWEKNELGIPTSGEYYGLIRKKEGQGRAAVQSGCGDGRADEQSWSLSSWGPIRVTAELERETQLHSVVTWAAGGVKAPVQLGD